VSSSGKNFFVAAAILTFLLFAGFEVYRKSEKLVLSVIEPSVIQIDLNSDKIGGSDEIVCVQTMPQNLLPKDSLSVEYLALEFAEKTLAGKKVKVKFSGRKNKDCRYADLYLNGQNYAQILTDAGFNPLTPGRLEQARKLDLVILNHKSGKYHKPDCLYGHAAYDSVVLLKKQLPPDAVPCKFCHKKQEPSVKTYPLIITSSNIKMFLTDFTLKLKPDSRCESPVCKEVLDLINNSHSTIDMAVFGWDKVPAVENALKNAMKRGVKIRLIYDKTKFYTDTPKLAVLIPDSLCSANKGLMHNKFIVSDNQKTLTGSMNFSRTGLSGFNANNVLVINSGETARKFTDEFNRMYSGKTGKTSGYTSCSGTCVYFSPQDKITVNYIIPLINSSKNYVYLPVFIITHNGLSQALINAKNRGVNVKVIIDATNPVGKGSEVNKLRQAGIPVKTENYAGKMHSKTIIIDDKYLVTGSMNFSGSGENKNNENVVIIEDNRLAKHYKGYFEYLWNKIPDKYLKINVRSEGIYSIGSCTDGIDNNFDGKTDSDDIGCKQAAK
jgi:phosphatidylserine/phosphatidylglycerophosphate/cardiolipin synthase-like enzyme